MNNNCEFAGSECCLCSTCEVVRKAMEDAEKITREEVDKLFCDAEKLLEDIKIQEKEKEKNGRKEE